MKYTDLPSVLLSLHAQKSLHYSDGNLLSVLGGTKRILENEDDRIATHEHLANEAVAIDGLRLSLALPGLWGLQQKERVSEEGVQRQSLVLTDHK